jgi:hypothetical protein
VRVVTSLCVLLRHVDLLTSSPIGLIVDIHTAIARIKLVHGLADHPWKLIDKQLTLVIRLEMVHLRIGVSLLLNDLAIRTLQSRLLSLGIVNSVISLFDVRPGARTSHTSILLRYIQLVPPVIPLIHLLLLLLIVLLYIFKVIHRRWALRHPTIFY